METRSRSHRTQLQRAFDRCTVAGEAIRLKASRERAAYIAKRDAFANANKTAQHLESVRTGPEWASSDVHTAVAIDHAAMELAWVATRTYMEAEEEWHAACKLHDEALADYMRQLSMDWAAQAAILETDETGEGLEPELGTCDKPQSH